MQRTLSGFFVTTERKRQRGEDVDSGTGGSSGKRRRVADEKEQGSGSQSGDMDQGGPGVSLSKDLVGREELVEEKEEGESSSVGSAGALTVVQKMQIEKNRQRALERQRRAGGSAMLQRVCRLLSCEEWRATLEKEFGKPYFEKLCDFLAEEEKRKAVVYPPEKDLFNALNSCPPSKVKVVILGQDPYHGPNQAHGLCFSVLPGNRIPGSLRNIYKELNEDPGVPFTIPKTGFLQAWCDQGVLLLNASLSVRKASAGSHMKKGWELFTDRVIERINEEQEHVVFLLWGKKAQDKASMVSSSRHLILKAPHPSPLSAHTGFLGCRHFSKANAYLKTHGKGEIDWELKE